MRSPTGHLEYYTRHGINPVRYDTSDLGRHLERRASLYRMLGITALTVRGARILEVAPGTGQNSLYLAHRAPGTFTLVEPNPVAVRDIADVYDRAGTGILRPLVVQTRFEDFETDERFDLVVCENWLGSSDHERGLLRKLGSLVASGGLLVVTAVSPVGILPNLLRRALSNKLTHPDEPFEAQAAALCKAFGPHLRTVAGMTRSVTDWVHDNMLNPAYLDILLTVPMVLDELGGGFDSLGTSPDFATDWRWFKGLWGGEREFNRHLLGQYRAALHNFFDHRTLLPARDPVRNGELDAASLAVCEAIRTWEAGVSDADAVEESVRRVRMGMNDLPAAWSAALDEFQDAFANPRLTPETVADLPLFGSLFGRETIYLSFELR